MKTQEQVILEDLHKFLLKNGILSATTNQRIEVYAVGGDIPIYFFINKCSIYLLPDTDVWSTKIVSLADPQYREKFLGYLAQLGGLKNV